MKMTKQTNKQIEINQVLWTAADSFRGKVNSDEYKNYILVMLFVKYVSDIYKEHYEKLMKKYDGDKEMVERQNDLDGLGA